MFRALLAFFLASAVLLAPPGRALAAEASAAATDVTEPVSWEPPALPDGWTTVRGVAFEAHGHLEHLGVLDRLVAHGSTSLGRLADELGVPVGGTIRVYVADDPDTFRELQPGAPPFWADGTAWPGLGVIFLRHPSLRGANPTPLEAVLDHELVHILLGRAFAPAPTPHWLQEGVAQVYAGEVGPDLPFKISRGLLGGEPLSLESLTVAFPREPHRAALAYAQTADFVQWFEATWGRDATRRLIRESAAGRPLSSILYGITGQTLPMIDDQWRERLASSTSAWTAPQNLEGALWGFGGVLLLAGGYLRRRAFRQRMLTWQDQDRRLDLLARALLARR